MSQVDWLRLRTFNDSQNAAFVAMRIFGGESFVSSTATLRDFGLCAKAIIISLHSRLSSCVNYCNGETFMWFSFDQGFKGLGFIKQ